MSSDQIETGDELVSLIEQCLQDTGDLPPASSEDALEALRHARHVRFSTLAQTSSQLLQNDKLPVYHRGLAARLLACTLSHAPGPAIAEQIQSTLPVVSAILDTMNKASSGLSYNGAPPLTPSDGHRVGMNCAAALAQIHDPGGKSSRHALDVASKSMHMEPYPEYTEQMYDGERLQRPGSPAYFEERGGGGGRAGGNRWRMDTADTDGTNGTGFWTAAGRSSTAWESPGNTRGSMGTRSSLGGRSTGTTGTTGTLDSHATTIGAYDYERGTRPEHRPQTQFSEMAGDMGLYDTDVKRTMHVLQVADDSQVVESKNIGKSKMLESLSQAVGASHWEEGKEEGGGGGGEGGGEGDGGPVHVRRRLRGESPATYDDFIRVMLATPAQGAPSRNFNKTTHPDLQRLSHTVRSNWAAMPHYLQALGLLENYPMHAHQQTLKVQRAIERNKRREKNALLLVAKNLQLILELFLVLIHQVLERKHSHKYLLMREATMVSQQRIVGKSDSWTPGSWDTTSP